MFKEIKEQLNSYIGLVFTKQRLKEITNLAKDQGYKTFINSTVHNKSVNISIDSNGHISNIEVIN